MRFNLRRSVAIIDYFPAFAFLLIAFGWTSMIVLSHYPTSSFAWAFTFWANDMLQEVFYFFSHFSGIPVVGHLLIALSAAGLSVVAVRRDWRSCRFVSSHYALLLMVMPLVGQGTRLSGPPGDINLHLLFRLTENLSPISVVLALGLLVVCIICHYRAIFKGITRKSLLRRRL